MSKRMLRPAPANFRQHAAGLSLSAAERLWHASFPTLKRWYADAGIAPASNALVTPPGFVEAASDTPLRGLCERFNLPYWRVRRLIVHHGLRAYRPPARQTPPAPRLIRRPQLAKVGTKPSPLGRQTPASSGMRASNDTSRAGQCADHLRRRGFVPVHRAYVTDKAAPMTRWIVGRRAMDEADMIDLACAKGFVAFDTIPTTTAQGARA